MTIKELEQKYDDGAKALCDFQDIIHKRIISYEDRISDESMPFWCKILKTINDDYVKELVYEVFSEYIYYREHDCFDDLEELSKAYLDDRCFIFDFKPGDFIATKYGEPEKIISITMYQAHCYPVINTEKRYVEEHVVVTENEIDYPDIAQYHKVDNVNTYGLYNKYGEEEDYYWR